MPIYFIHKHCISTTLPYFTWTKLAQKPTVKHSSAELRGRGQREAGVVKLVAVVTDADLKLDSIVNVLQERG